MVLRCFLPLLLCASLVSADNPQARDSLLWDYSDFHQALRHGEWERAAKYLAKDSKIGFGGDLGLSGFHSVVRDDPSCVRSLILALDQGCRLEHANRELGCVSPPQFANPDVLYLGARVKFVYREASDAVVIRYLVCGGD